MKNTQSAASFIRIHGAFPFDRGAKARWLLTEMGVSYEDRWLDVQKGDHEEAEYMNIHPMGRIPAAQIGDLTMFESGAICAYLADQHLDKGMAPALSSPERAKYQQWMYFAVSTLDPIQSKIQIIEDIPAGEVRTTKESALFEELHDAIGALDQTLSKSSFLVGNHFTAADICVSYQLYWLSAWPELDVIIRKSPNVVSYMDRMKKMPSALKANVFSYEG